MREVRNFFLAVLGALAVLLGALSVSPALAREVPVDLRLVERANNYVWEKFGFSEFFAPTNQQGQGLRQHWLKSDMVPDSFPILVWGPWHGDMKGDRARFIGYGKYGEDVTNVEFPPDRSGGGRSIASLNWIPRPWEDYSVRKAFPNFVKSRRLDAKANPEVVQRLRWGVEYTCWANGFAFDPSAPVYQSPQEYVHITVPPTPDTWGMGVMFHDEGSGVWYVSVPIPPKPPVMPDYAVDVQPREQTGQVGQAVTFDITVSWRDNPSDRTWRLILAHKVGDRQYPVPFVLTGGGETVQSIQLDDQSYADFPGIGQWEGEVHVQATVHVQEVPSTLVAQVVPVDGNTDMPLPIEPPYDFDPSDNEVAAQIKPLGCDLAVSVRPAGSYRLPWTGGCVNAGALVDVRRKDQGPPVEAVLTLQGPAGTQEKRFTIAGGERKTFGYSFRACSPGNYAVSAEVWPVPREQELYPPDNAASAVVSVAKTQPPPTPKSDVHVELGGS
ncbi:hypothetical protein Adeg_0758 [Ammonifex degensii KC4]|uniref:Uncharacterized protein n=1 Tax=Ammonifex degensii (strain DSM 10501 / KC4) TaxID=429009 RepID=C9RCC6_AMMDK|nr:hypothetical protein [Ammonifex degensii]ACX51903.1 hypothetical protein Adeg_0758 [Ammonifex degensii KC4]